MRDEKDKICTSFSNGVDSFEEPICHPTNNRIMDSGQPYSLGDFNNDGITDILHFQNQMLIGTDGVLKFIMAPKGYKTSSFIDYGQQFLYKKHVQRQPNSNDRYNGERWNNQHHIRHVGDMNGDGIVDILGMGSKNILVQLGKTLNFQPP